MHEDDVSRRVFLATLPVLAATVAWTGRGERDETAGRGGGGSPRRVSGRGEPPGAAPPQQLPVPDWMQVDREAGTVSLEIVAGETDVNNSWNFNGLTRGEADIVVPEGFEVRITFRNGDSASPHSLGIAELQDPWPATFADPSPVFEGAITSNPTSMTDATPPGESEEIAFTADAAGEYAVVCYLPGHALTGMWTYFVVSAEGAAGVRERG